MRDVWVDKSMWHKASVVLQSDRVASYEAAERADGRRSENLECVNHAE